MGIGAVKLQNDKKRTIKVTQTYDFVVLFLGGVYMTPFSILRVLCLIIYMTMWRLKMQIYENSIVIYFVCQPQKRSFMKTLVIHMSITY